MSKTENINNIGLFINFKLGKMKVKHLNKDGNTIFDNNEFNIDYLDLFEIDNLNKTHGYNFIFDKIIQKIESKIELNQLGIPPTPSNTPANFINSSRNRSIKSNVDLTPMVKNLPDSNNTDSPPNVNEIIKNNETLNNNNNIANKKGGGKTKNKRNKKNKNTLKIIS